MSDLQDDVAAFLASQGAGAGAGGAANKKKKKKGKKKPNAADAGDAAPTADDQAPPSPVAAAEAQESPSDEAAAAPDVADDAAKALAALGISVGGGDADKKKGNKKKKKKKPAEEKKGPQQSAMAKRAAEAIQRRKEEEEALRKAQEEAELLAQAEEERIKELERKEQEAKDKKAAKRRQKKANAIAKGKPVTKAEKMKAERLRQQREMLQASGMVVGADEEAPKKVKPNYSKKKKTVSAPKEAEKPKEEEEAQQQQAEEQQAAVEEEDAPKDAAAEDEDAPPAEAPVFQAPAFESWEDAEDDEWDTAVLDKIAALKAEDEELEVVVDEKPVYTAPTSTTPTGGKGGKKKGGKKKGGNKRGGKGNKGNTANKDSDSDSDAESSSDDSEDEHGMSKKELRRAAVEAKKEAAREKREERLRQALKNRSKDDLRSPICVVLGHVDTGKTKLLDKIRRTNVQEGEAGGITQQIGATYFPMENLRVATDKLNEGMNLEYQIPGLLVIDTPGHESFTNLRTRGSSLCDIAILVIDIMHGLEQQTIESIGLLRRRGTPFVVALNKVDRLYDWQSIPNNPFCDSLSKQKDFVISEFETRTQKVITQLNEQGLNAALYYENTNHKQVVSLVPTSAHSGEGVPDLLLLLVQLTQRMMVNKLMYHSELQCSVIEVKKIEGIGTTIDVVLVNGMLHDTDRIVIAGTNGPIVTQVRALLTPQPLKEMRVKGEYVHHKEIRAAMGVKIVANDLEHAIAGTSLHVVGEDDDEEELMDLVCEDVSQVMGNVEPRGVFVQASTLGSLEALMEFLKVSNIPVAHVGIGPVHKKDVSRASVMLSHKREYATILAFDVKVTREAQEIAESLEVKIFTAEIIYHLFDQFTAYLKEVEEQRKQDSALLAVFPSVVRIIPEFVFMKKNPLVLGVDVVEGILKVGTPMVVPDQWVNDPDHPGETMMLSLGRITSIEKDNKTMEIAKKGSSVCIKIQPNASQSYVQYGRHFDSDNLLYSKLTRESIDCLKSTFKDDLQKEDWMLVIKMKKLFGII